MSDSRPRVRRVSVGLLAASLGMLAASSSSGRPIQGGTQWIDMATTPALVIGNAPDGSEDFADVRFATRLSNGHLAVADAGNYQVRIYDRNRRLIGRIGRRGQGPGDFSSILGMWRTPGDSLVVWDLQLGRATVLSPSARFVRFWPTLPRVPVRRVRGVFPDGSLLADTRSEYELPRATAIVPIQTLLVRLSKAGAVVDSLGWFLQGETLVTIRDGRPTGSSVVPLGRSGQFAMVDDGFYYGDGTALRVDRIGGRGSRVRTLAATVPVEPLSSADRRTIVEAYLARTRMPPAVLEQFRRGFEPLLTRSAPVFDTLFADPLGRAWVRLTKRPSETHAYWLVLGPGEGSVKRVRMPTRLTVLEIGAGHLLATADDDDGRPLLLEFPVRLPD